MPRISNKPVGRWSWRYRRTRRGYPFRHGFAFTLSGGAYVLVCLMVGLAAANNQINPLLLIFGILLGGMLVSGLVSTLTLTGLRAIRRLPASAMAGQAVLLTYQVTNVKHWLSSYSLHVSEHSPPASCGEAYLLTVLPGRAVVQPAVLLCDRRGIYQFQALTVYTRFPFSLFVHFARFKGLDELVVHPAIGRLTRDAASLIARGVGAGQQALSRSGGQDEFYGLREYRAGDNPRRIHWRRSARLGTPVVREMSPLTPRRLIVVLSVVRAAGTVPDDGPDDRLELALALAATVINDAMRRGLEVGLLVAHGECDGDQRWFPPASGRRLWLSMMRALASLSPAQDHAPTSWWRSFPSRAGGTGFQPVVSHRLKTCATAPGQGREHMPIEWLRELARAASQCLWMTYGLDQAEVQAELACLASWNIAVQPMAVEQTELDRLIVLPASPADPLANLATAGPDRPIQ